MKLTAKLFSVLIVMLLTVPVFFINGCGDSGSALLGGGTTGPCKEGAMPAGWSIEPGEILGEADTAEPKCWPVVFTVVDEMGDPANGICVRVYTDGASTIAKETTSSQLCSATPVYNQLTTRTDDYGHIQLQFVVPPCTSGQEFFVAATSGGVSAEYTVSCP